MTTASSGIPVAPRVLQDLLLAKRACTLMGEAGEPVELWEAYTLAQADSAALTRDLEPLRGRGTVGVAIQARLKEVRGTTAPLVEYLRQALPGNLPLLADAAALDLALVFIMSTPPARDAVVRWFKNPSASRDEATRLLRTMGRMVETYRQAMSETPPAPPQAAPPAPKAAPVEADETERLLQERLDAQRKSRDRSITERRTREKDDAEKLARAKEDAERAAVEKARSEEKTETDRIEREKADAERLAREKTEEDRRAREQAEAEKIAREKAEAERLAREKAEADHKARELAEAERAAREKAEAETAARAKAEAERIVREKAEAERVAREKAEAEKAAQAKAEAERIAREKAEAEKLAREKAEAERIAREKAEAEKAAKAKAEAERIAREKAEAEAERVAREKAEAERLAKEKAEAERVAREKAKAEAERIAREKAQAERLAREKAEAERKAREQAEAERIAREKAEAERIAREKAEAERVAREKAEAERLAKEKAEADRIAREKAEAQRVAREKADGRLTPEEREGRDKARVELRARLPELLADPWRDQKVGSWFRVKTVAGKEETLTDLGLRERGKGYTVLGVQQHVAGRTEWEKWERTELRSTQLLGQEMLEVGGAPVECDLYQLVSRAGEEKVWVLLDGTHAGAPVKSESPGASFLAKAIDKETLVVGTKSFECARIEGEETRGGKESGVIRWWSPLYPLGPIKSTGDALVTEAVKAGEDWNRRPPFPS